MKALRVHLLSADGENDLMTLLLVGTATGCLVFTDSGERESELRNRKVGALTREPDGSCVAVLNSQEIWRRDPAGAWSQVAMADMPLQSIASVKDAIFVGAANEAAVLRIGADRRAERLKSFDETPGRSEWFGQGPPLGVRSLTATAGGEVILAGVHVGGIPRSSDGGESWRPVIPVNFDVHEVRAHPVLPNIVAAAAAVGLCVSHDGGANWNVLSGGLNPKYSLAVAILQDEVLFSIQDGPFAKRSQVWRWRIGGDQVEQVRDGLPLWLDGRVDTAHIAADGDRSAIVDGGGNLWLSRTGSRNWERVATGLGSVSGIAMLQEGHLH